MRQGPVRLGVGLLAALVACTRTDDPPCRTGCGEDTAPPDDPGPPPLVPDTAVSVASSGIRTCADPSLREEAKFDVRVSVYEIEKKIWFWGGGLAVGDLTDDGYRDIVLPGFWATIFYRGTADEGFVYDQEILAGFPLDGGSGASVADYDGDGDLDLFVTRFLGKNVLLRNDGGTFTDVSAEAGLSAEPVRNMSSSWADYDGDGDLDLFVGVYGWIDESGVPHSQFAPAQPNALYVNDGDGTFTDVSATLPPEAHDGYTLSGGFHDLDGDLRPELYVVNDFGQAYPNALLWNRGGGALELDHNAAGLDIGITAMGLGLNDLNGDEIPDLVQPFWNGISLLESHAELGIWSEWGAVRGIAYDAEIGQKIGWGAELVDVDNDGDLDVPVAFGYLDSVYPAPYLQPDALYIRQADGSFVDEAAAWGVADTYPGRGFAAVDLNDDGWLDLVKRSLDGPTRMHLSRCGAEGWLRIRLHQAGPNTFAIGARVVVVADGERQVRWVAAGGTNHASGGPPEVHFGLGDHDVVDRIEVIWPDGAISAVEAVDARQILDLTRGSAEE